MRPIGLGIGRIGVDLVERDFVFVDVRIVQRFVVVQMTGDLDAGLEPLFQQMLVAEVRLVFLQRLRFDAGAEVVELFRPLVGQFHREEDDAAEDRDPHVNLVAGRTAAS